MILCSANIVTSMKQIVMTLYDIIWNVFILSIDIYTIHIIN